MVQQSTVHPFRQDVEVIALVGLAHGISHFFQLLLPTLFPWLMGEYALSFTQVGLLTTLCFAVSAIGQAPGGFVVDALGPHRVLLGALSLFVLAALMVAHATSFSQLCVAAVLIGLGNSVFHPADFTLLNRRVSTARLGHAFSVHGLSGNLGWALAPALLAAVATVSGWRSAAWVAGLIAMLPWVVFLWRRHVLSVSVTAQVPEQSSDEAASQGPSRSPSKRASLLTQQFAFLTSPGVWMSFCFFLIVSIAFGGMQNFTPSVFMTLYQVTPKAGAWLLTVFLVGGSMGMLAGGFLVSRQQSNDKTIALVLTLAALCLWLLASGELPVSLCFVVVFCAGCATGLAGPARDTLVRQSAINKFGAQALGRIYGLVYSGLDVGIALSPILFGGLLDLNLPGGVLVTVALFYATGGVIALMMGRQQNRAAPAV